MEEGLNTLHREDTNGKEGIQKELEEEVCDSETHPDEEDVYLDIH